MTYDMFGVQTALWSQGFYHGKIDGIRGPLTNAAIIAFKKSQGLLPRDYLGPITYRKLMKLRDDEPDPVETELPWITEGRIPFGWHEVRDNAKLRVWLKSDNKTLGDPKALPWCGDYVETAIRNSLPNEPFPGDLGRNPYWAQNWKHLGKAVLPCYGAIMVFVRDGGGHVGFAVGEDSTSWYVLGGNQGNTVSITRISKKRMIACRWPDTYPHQPKKLPRMEPGKIPLSTNEF
tara:strand:- start:6841 stop:7539 length:699 start_codon:yes stop_codon:yes gene_type:complete